MFCENCNANLSRDVLPVRSVGVQGDFRTYRFPAILDFGPAKENEYPVKVDGMKHFPGKREKN